MPRSNGSPDLVKSSTARPFGAMALGVWASVWTVDPAASDKRTILLAGILPMIPDSASRTTKREERVSSIRRTSTHALLGTEIPLPSSASIAARPKVKPRSCATCLPTLSIIWPADIRPRIVPLLVICPVRNSWPTTRPRASAIAPRELTRNILLENGSVVMLRKNPRMPGAAPRTESALAARATSTDPLAALVPPRGAAPLTGAPRTALARAIPAPPPRAPPPGTCIADKPHCNASSRIRVFLSPASMSTGYQRE